MELHLIQAPSVVSELVAVKDGLKLHQLLHHAQEVCAGAAGGIDHLHLVKGIAYSAGCYGRDAGGVAVVHKAGNRFRIQANVLPRQVALESLTAHERYHWPGRVVCPRVVTPRHQLLKYLAQHLRVHRHLYVEGRGLHDGEVEPVEQAAQYLLDGVVRHADSLAPIQVGLLEQAAVEEGRVSNAGAQDFRLPALRSMDCELLRPAKKSASSLSV